MHYIFYAFTGFLIAGGVLLTSGFTSKIHFWDKELSSLWIFIAFVFLSFLFFVLKTKRFLIFLFISSIFFWIDKNFLYQPNHAGGAIGISIGVFDIALISLFIFFLFDRFKASQPSFRIPFVVIPILLWIIFSIFSIFNSVNITLSLLEIVRMLKVIIVVLLVSNLLKTESDIKFIIFCLVIMLFSESILGLLQYILKGTVGLRFFGEEEKIMSEYLMEGTEIRRISGTFVHSHTYSHALGFLIPFPFIFGLIYRKGILKFLFIIVFILGIAALLATFTRTNILSISASMIVIIYLVTKKRLWNIKNRIMIILIICFSLIGTLPLIPRFYQRLLHANPGSLNVRLDYNKTSLSMLNDHPLIGIGINTYTENLEYRGNPFGLLDRMPEGQAVEHNLFMLITVETGILGIFSFLFILITLLHRAILCYKSENIFMVGLGITMIAGYVNFIIRSIFDFSFRLDQTFFLFWFLAGFVFVPYPLNSKNTSTM